MLLILGEEAIVHGINDDDALRRHAHLPCVPVATKSSPLCGLLDLSIFQNDESVSTTKLQGGLLQVLSCDGRDSTACSFGTGESHTADAWVGEDLLTGLMGSEDVGQHAVRESGLAE